MTVFEEAFHACEEHRTVSMRAYFAHMLSMDKEALLDLHGNAATILAAQCLYMMFNSVRLSEAEFARCKTYNDVSAIIRRLSAARPSAQPAKQPRYRRAS